MIFGGDGLKSFGLGAAFAVALELGVHIIVHYTVPGATFAAGLAQQLAPVMDGMGLTSIFSDAATSAAGETLTTSASEIASDSASECLSGGFCPIHNPIVGEPLIAPPAALPVMPLPSDLENLPVLGQ